MEESFDVFLGYPFDDAGAARQLADALREHGLRPWLAEEQIGRRGTWDAEPLDVLRTVPAALQIVRDRWPLGEWGVREVEEMAARKRAAPSFRLAVAVLGTAAVPPFPVRPDAVVHLVSPWDPGRLATLAEALRPGRLAEDLPLSSSVQAATRVSGNVTSFMIVRRLLEAHSDYTPAPVPPEALTPDDKAEERSAAEWVADVRALYDPARNDILDGRLFIDGLARLDRGLRRKLEAAGVLGAVRSRISPPAEARLLAKPDSVDMLTDQPADVDLLGRQVVAEVIARRIRTIRQEEVKRQAVARAGERSHAGPFLLHLFGPWGVGKTSLLRFIRAELTPPRDADRPRPDPKAPDAPWIVIDFNAWQHQRIVPPWWWLMNALFRQGSTELRHIDKRRWVRLRWWDLRWRGQGALPGLLLAAVGVAVAMLVWRSGSIDTKGWAEVFKGMGAVAAAISGVIALGLTALGGLQALSRSLLVGSPRAAGAFIKNSKDPLDTLSERFVELVRRLEYPVAIFVDDLDRCKAPYVVELLEGIQTLFKDVSVVYVVAADRDWLCESYAKEYADFCATTGEPGRPLGYLFLEKTFQLSAAVPTLSLDAKRDFLQGLLGVTGAEVEAELKAARVMARDEFDKAGSEKEVRAKLEQADGGTAIERQAAAEAAVLRLAQPDIEERTQHTLQAFAPLLEPNPRAMKRLVNAYGMARDSEILRGASASANGDAPMERVALWTILNLRWPLLAEYLANDEDAAEQMCLPQSKAPDDAPEFVKKLWGDDDVLAVLKGEAPTVTTILDAEAIRRCVGKSRRA
jgi:KAP family P-loop domain